jgi:hypothetical protein
MKILLTLTCLLFLSCASRPGSEYNPMASVDPSDFETPSESTESAN